MKVYTDSFGTWVLDEPGQALLRWSHGRWYFMNTDPEVLEIDKLLIYLDCIEIVQKEELIHALLERV